MCLNTDKALTERLFTNRKPDDWIVLYKWLEVKLVFYPQGLRIVTPYRYAVVNLDSQIMKPKGRSRRGLQTYHGRCIHTYYKKPSWFRQGRYSLLVKCYAQVKNVLAVGDGGDVVTTELVIDHNELNRLRRAIELAPLKFEQKQTVMLK